MLIALFMKSFESDCIYKEYQLQEINITQRASIIRFHVFLVLSYFEYLIICHFLISVIWVPWYPNVMIGRFYNIMLVELDRLIQRPGIRNDWLKNLRKY